MKLIAWVAIAILATYLVFVGGGWLGIYSSSLRLVTMMAASALLVGWFLVAIRSHGWRVRSVMLPAIFVCLFSLAISTLFSRVPRVSAEYLGYALVLASLYLLLVRLFAHPFFARRLAVLATLFFLAICALFLALVVMHWIEWWRLVGRLTLPPLRPSHEGLTYLNPSAVLTIAVLLAVPAIATFGGPTPRGIATSVAILLLIGMVALLSGSRAGWLALALAGLGAALMWAVDRDRRRGIRTSARQLLMTTRGKAVAVGMGALLVIGVLTFGPSIAFRASEGGEGLRLTYIATAARMFESSVLFGTGPGTWVIQRISQTAGTEPDYYIPHAHNIEAQTLAELGLVGAFAAVVLVANLLWLARDGAADADPTRRRWTWATAIALIYLALHQQLDFYANMPAVLLAGAIPVAYLDATVSSRLAVPGRAARFWPISLNAPIARLGALALAVAVLGLIWQERAAGDLATAVAAADAGDWATARGPAKEAVTLDPVIGTYQLVEGLAASRSGEHLAAATAFQLVADRDDLPEAWLNLAAERLELGDAQGAIAAARSASRLGLQRPAVSMPLGDLALRLGDVDLATTSFAAAIAVTPSLAADTWWSADPSRVRIFDKVIERALSFASPMARWDIAFMAGKAEIAKALASADGQQPLADQLMAAWSGDVLAANSVIEQCRERPYDLTGLAWCARLDWRNGEFDRADKWREMAEIVIGGAAQSGAELRVDTQRASTFMAGNPASFWATFTYRRPGPADLLVADLVHLTLQ